MAQKIVVVDAYTTRTILRQLQQALDWIRKEQPTSMELGFARSRIEGAIWDITAYAVTDAVVEQTDQRQEEMKV